MNPEIRRLQFKLTLVLAAFFFVDLATFFLAVTPVLGIYIVYARPPWFLRLVERLYQRPGPDGRESSGRITTGR